MTPEQQNCRNCNHCVVPYSNIPSMDRCIKYGTYCDVVLNGGKFIVGGEHCTGNNLISWVPKPTFFQRIRELFQ